MASTEGKQQGKRFFFEKKTKKLLHIQAELQFVKVFWFFLSKRTTSYFLPWSNTCKSVV